jgi:AcrR family transcriptional regulator
VKIAIRFYMPRITEARKTERRDQILEAAFACFSKAGFQHTTMQDICAEAKLSPGAVYGYFPGKDAIIAALARGERKANAGSAQPAAAGSGLEPLFASLARPGDPRAFQMDLRLWSEGIGDAALGDLDRRRHAALVQVLTTAVAEAAKARGLAPDALAELIAAVIAGIEVRIALDPAADPAPTVQALRALLA